MSDLIKREDAIKAVAEVLSLNRFASFKDIKDFHRFAERVLRSVPSADRPQEWVPCRERMPSEQGQYLVTFPLCNGEPWVYILSFNKGKFYETDDEWGNVEYDDVTAWMPLPKPWKGADDE